jgi:hypothetical protein
MRGFAPHTPKRNCDAPMRCLPLHPTRPCRQHHSAGEVQVFVHPPAARIGNDPLGTDEERHAATVTDAEKSNASPIPQDRHKADL